MKPFKTFSDTEKDYLKRVAGRVPIEFISQHIERDVKSVRDFCFRHKLAMKVPHKLLKKHWPEYLPKKREPS